ncbi:hypothetical protein EJ05DRAFT_482802 [Pseudovirgaria hyperparasitica]|uniref:FAM50A/XAP5 C-terminal domain-containing protein n=1 Tax=Pseudovirgaria hyperparasitica TaxID=470096 RepID=A0A6A6WK00_9PEZI|nr:uncharacterized protein EJ05DRAFT_482802 [Pseudovirgaria hyperparasitica]KAF2762001.1 hypothetical protein EJ05DRAFT_482802 [Pseudovirgaria hyperparasitica]
MSAPPSGSSTPNSRFTSQAHTAEDLLKSQTVGLVNLTDFRKRRAEALEQKERELQSGSGASTPQSDRVPFKKRKKGALAKAKLSFGVDTDDADNDDTTDSAGLSSGIPTPRAKSHTPALEGEDTGVNNTTVAPRKRLGPNTLFASNAPKAKTKSALARDAATRDQLRREFLVMRERVKETPFILPFVFYDGTNIPGGACRVKKGEHVWLFLDKARKVGAEHGAGSGDKGRREWARVGVDDLMLVRGDIIVPHVCAFFPFPTLTRTPPSTHAFSSTVHTEVYLTPAPPSQHYEFYYFLANKTLNFSAQRLFPHSAEPTPATPAEPASSSADTDIDPSTYDPLARHDKKDNDTSSSSSFTVLPDSELEGADEEPSVTKVVDRRWYERNKHIYPASIWEEFDPGKDYSRGVRKDAQGNSFFFS